MAENQIAAALAQRNLKVASFARQIGMSQQTLYNVVKKQSIDNIGISTFLKIADGLGVTAEELYYGAKRVEMAADDQQQAAINSNYERLNERGREILAEQARMMANSSLYTDKSERDQISKTA